MAGQDVFTTDPESWPEPLPRPEPYLLDEDSVARPGVRGVDENPPHGEAHDALLEAVHAHAAAADGAAEAQDDRRGRERDVDLDPEGVPRSHGHAAGQRTWVVEIEPSRKESTISSVRILARSTCLVPDSDVDVCHSRTFVGSAEPSGGRAAKGHR